MGSAAERGAPPPGRRLEPVSHSWLGALFMGRMGASTLSSMRDRSGGRLPSPSTLTSSLKYICVLQACPCRPEESITTLHTTDIHGSVVLN